MQVQGVESQMSEFVANGTKRVNGDEKRQAELNFAKRNLNCNS